MPENREVKVDSSSTMVATKIPFISFLIRLCARSVTLDAITFIFWLS